MIESMLALDANCDVSSPENDKPGETTAVKVNQDAGTTSSFSSSNSHISVAAAAAAASEKDPRESDITCILAGI